MPSQQNTNGPLLQSYILISVLSAISQVYPCADEEEDCELDDPEEAEEDDPEEDEPDDDCELDEADD